MSKVLTMLKEKLSFGTINIGEAELKQIKVVQPNPNLLDMIVFPKVDMDDPYKTTLFVSAYQSMKECFRRGYFSICDVDKFIKLADIALHQQPKEDYDWLYGLHCVHFNQMDPDIYRELPVRINNVFSNGTIAAEYSVITVD